MTRQLCDRCEGVGLVYMMPDGHEIECPQCEGEGRIKKYLVDNLDRAIDWLVKEGRVERIVINGRPGVRLINKEEEELKS